MELRCLRNFVAVAQEQSFSRDAKLLHISQPPLSRRIRAIEEEQGFDHFERTTRNYRLPAAVSAFYAQTQPPSDPRDQSARVYQKITPGTKSTIQLVCKPNA